MHEIVTIIAKYFIFLTMLIAFLVWLKLDNAAKKQFLLIAVIGGILALIFAKIGSKLYYNPRPFVVGHFAPYFAHGNDNGFPSDHTLLASFMAYIVFKYHRKIGIALFVLALAIGLSRVIAGVHHLIDIVGSCLFSLLAFYVANLLVIRHSHMENVNTKRKGS